MCLGDLGFDRADLDSDPDAHVDADADRNGDADTDAAVSDTNS